MALSSASTDAQVWAAYEDNSAYEENDSVSQARAFLQACRIILMRQPLRSRHDGTEVQYDTNAIREEMLAAKMFVDANGTTATEGGGNVRFLDFRGMRT